MPETPANALLKRRGIVALGQHLGIVIALEYQGIAAMQTPDHMRRRKTQVCQNAKAATSIGQDELDRLTRIMRDGKRLYLQVSDRKGSVAVNQAQIQPHTLDTRLCLRNRSIRTVCHAELGAVAFGTGEGATNMVAMLMRHDDGIQCIGIHAQTGATLRQIARAKTAIDKNPRSASFNKQGITFATAAK